MNHVAATDAMYTPWPRWWRTVVVAICTLILCSCSARRQATSPANHQSPIINHQSPIPNSPSPALPRQASIGAPGGTPAYAVVPVAAGPDDMAGGAVPAA